MNQGIQGRHGFRRFFAAVVTTALTAAGASVAFGQSSGSVWDGVYTEAQAKQGEAVYFSHCVDCHGPDLAGREQAAALAGLGFMDKWNRTALRKLYETVEQMPPDEPKVLPPQQYVDVLAYLLSANGLPAGANALTVDRQALGRIEIRNVRPQK